MYRSIAWNAGKAAGIAAVVSVALYAGGPPAVAVYGAIQTTRTLVAVFSVSWSLGRAAYACLNDTGTNKSSANVGKASKF